MNDITEIADDAEQVADLSRRLQDIAQTTTIDTEAWEKIQTRIAGSRSRSAFGLRGRWPLAAAVAAIVLFGILVVYKRDEGLFVNTVDDKTSTTDHNAATTTDPTTTTSILVEPEVPPNGGTGTGTGTGSGTGTGTGTGSGTGTGTGSGTGPGTPPPDVGAVPPTSTAPTTPPITTLPDGKPIAASIGQSGYTVDIGVYESGGSYYLDLWRDKQEYLDTWSWAVRPGNNCLAGGPASTGDLANVRWGFVTSNASRVRLTTTSGNTSTAILGAEVASGVRSWIAQRPLGQLDHIDALDSAGNVLHTAPAPGFDATADTC